MNTQNSWKQRTLSQLCEIHDRLIEELAELSRDIQRLSELIDHNGELEQKRQRRQVVTHHLDDLARIIPVRLVDEQAA